MAKKADPNKLELFKDIFSDYILQLDACPAEWRS